MKEKRIKELRLELKYLEKDVIDEEIKKHNKELEKDNVKDIARMIYHERGIDYNLINRNIFNRLIYEISSFVNLFQNNDKKIRKRMIIEVLYILLILILIRIPFMLVEDICFDYINLLTTKGIVIKLIHLLFLVIYTITIICSFIVLNRTFIKKYIKGAVMK